MTYSTAEGASFEKLLRVLRESPPHQIMRHLETATVRKALEEIGLPANLKVVATLMRSPRWKEWLRDYEEVRAAATLRVALELLPAEVARVLALEVARTRRGSEDQAAVAARAVASVMAPPAAEVESDLEITPGEAEDTPTEALTGSLRNVNESPLPDTDYPEPPAVAPHEEAEPWEREE